MPPLFVFMGGMWLFIGHNNYVPLRVKYHGSPQDEPVPGESHIKFRESGKKQ